MGKKSQGRKSVKKTGRRTTSRSTKANRTKQSSSTGRKKKKRTARSNPSTPRPTGNESSDVNKSQAIRDLLTEQPHLRPALIASVLGERGIDVTPQYVSMIKSATNKRARTQSKMFASGSSISLQQLVEVRNLIEKVGGIDQMERIIGLIRELQ